MALFDEEDVKGRPLICGKEGLLGGFVGTKQKGGNKIVPLYKPTMGGKRRSASYFKTILARIGFNRPQEYIQIHPDQLVPIGNQGASADGSFEMYMLVDWGREENTFLRKLGVEMQRNLNRVLQDREQAQKEAEFSRTESIKKSYGVDKEKSDLRKRLEQVRGYGGEY